MLASQGIGLKRKRERVTVTHKTADEMADHYGFSDSQCAQLAELLSEENRSMWDAVLAGVR